jgi:isoleucyl-tRNA synthetase
MYKNLEENIKIPDIEKEILDFWKNDNTFQKSIDTKPKDKQFIFYEGPPTANGMPGIHHVIARTVKDIICRYKTMQGYRVERKAGWDTHGLPVEVEVEKTLGIKSKEEIIELGAEKFNQACRDSIFKYLNEWEILTERMAYWIDLEHAYVTFHTDYIESVWWALKKLFDDGLIYKGFKILPYCPICESPLSSHEVAQGYVELKEASIYVKFRIKSGKFEGSDFLVWTTTPWTLPSNVALSVNAKHPYVRIELSETGERYVLAKERLSVIKDEYKIIDEVNGSELENTEYEPLFNFFNSEKKSYYVTLGDFVTMEDGTGIVHIAPAYGEDDYNIGLKYDLPVLQAVMKNGRFRDDAGRYAGMNFKEADPDIINDLKASGRLYKKEMFTHSYPHCWRHKTPLMYYATDSWFIRTTSFKDKLIEYNKTINWNPTEFGEGRFGNWLEENKDWALSRNRFWGTPLPIWYYEDENGTMHYEAIGSIEELRSKAKNFNEVYQEGQEPDLHKPYIDNIILMSDDGHEMKRTSEVIDCWFDSGSMPFAQFHYPFENKEKFERHHPADFIAEGLDQTRGWFYSLHVISTYLFNKPAYKNLIVNGLILDKFGKKMSKSLGNAVNPFEMIDKFGADILRWYLVGTTPVWKSKLFNEAEMIEVKNKFFDTLINTFRFFVIYANMSDFVYDESKRKPVSERVEIDKWIISKLNSLKQNYYDSMNSYDITKAAKYLFEFTLDEMSNWYIRRNRKRFRQPVDENDKMSAYQTLYEVLYEVIKMAAPISPFLSDKLYQLLTGKKSSVHLEEFTPYNKNEINAKLEDEMALAQKIVYLIRALRVKNNLKVRQPLRQILVPAMSKEQRETLERVKDIILEEVNIREMNIIGSDSEIISKKAKPNFKSIGPKYGKDVKKVQKIITDLTSEEITSVEEKGSVSKDGFIITSEDFEIHTDNIEGWLIEKEGNITVALDITLDDGLINEGILREFINRIQTFRKNSDFNVNDRVTIKLEADKKLTDILNANMEKLRNEVQCENLINTENIGDGFTETDINGIKCKFLVEKK